MNIYTNASIKKGSKLILNNGVTEFPENPVIGEFSFVNGVLYIYSKIRDDASSWYPLTNFAENYVHQQLISSSSWTIQHNLGSQNLAYFVYDNNNEYVLSEIQFIDDNTIKLNFTEEITGRCVIFASTNAFSQGQTTIIYVDKYAEKVKNHGEVSGQLVVSMEDGLVHKIISNGNLEISFDGWATGNRSSALTLNIFKTGTNNITFANVLWPDGYAPVFSEDSLNRLIFVSDDGGTTIQGFVAGLNIRVSA